MADDPLKAVESLTKIAPLNPHPILKVWKQKQKRKQSLLKYKKRRKRPKKGHIDIYV